MEILILILSIIILVINIILIFRFRDKGTQKADRTTSTTSFQIRKKHAGRDPIFERV